MAQKLGICDSDYHYGLKLMEYIQNENYNYEVCLFTNQDSLKEFLIINELDYLLIEKTIYPENIHIEKVKNIYLLINDPENKTNVEYPEIFKFQPVEQILKMISKKKAVEPISSKVTSIFTTSPSIFSLAFAWSYTLSISNHRNILFIPLDFYPVNIFTTQHQVTQGISDIIYYLKENNSCHIDKWKNYIQSMGNVKYIANTNHGFDLLSLDENDIREWISALQKSAEFEEIIFFANFSTPGIDALLDLSYQVINLKMNQPYEIRKAEEWKRQRGLMGRKVGSQKGIEEVSLYEEPFFLERDCFTLQELYNTYLWQQAKDYVEAQVLQ